MLSGMNYRKWLLLAAAIFLTGLMFGLFVQSGWLNDQLKGLQGTAGQIQGMSAPELFVFILLLRSA